MLVCLALAAGLLSAPSPHVLMDGAEPLLVGLYDSADGVATERLPRRLDGRSGPHVLLRKPSASTEKPRRGLLTRQPQPGAAERAHLAEPRKAPLPGDAQAAAGLRPAAAAAAPVLADPEGLDGPDVSLVVPDVSLVVSSGDSDRAAPKQLVFMHIPKNAGTTIENLGEAHGVAWGRFDTLAGANPGLDVFDGRSGETFCTEWHTPPDQLPSPNPYTDPSSEVFCVTRDPWERMVSEYVYQVGQKHRFRSDPINIEDFLALNSLIPDGKECTTEGFNGFVEMAIKRSKHNPSLLNCHMIPQWRFIEFDGQRWCDHILPIDELVPRFNELMKQAGLPPRLSPHDEDNAADSCPSLRKLARANLGALFAPSTRALMRVRYQDDFAHLGDQLAASGKGRWHRLDAEAKVQDVSGDRLQPADVPASRQAALPEPPRSGRGGADAGDVAPPPSHRGAVEYVHDV